MQQVFYVMFTWYFNFFSLWSVIGCLMCWYTRQLENIFNLISVAIWCHKFLMTKQVVNKALCLWSIDKHGISPDIYCLFPTEFTLSSLSSFSSHQVKQVQLLLPFLFGVGPLQSRHPPLHSLCVHPNWLWYCSLVQNSSSGHVYFLPLRMFTKDHLFWCFLTAIMAKVLCRTVVLPSQGLHHICHGQPTLLGIPSRLWSSNCCHLCTC